MSYNKMKKGDKMNDEEKDKKERDDLSRQESKNDLPVRKPDGLSKKRPLIRSFREFVILCGVAVLAVGFVTAFFFDGDVKDWGLALLGVAAMVLLPAFFKKKKRGIRRVFYIVGIVFGEIAIGFCVAGLVTHTEGVTFLGIPPLIVSVIALMLSGEGLH
jgi:peptidoglycan/LPS O-acetylase OafA/YrhL